MGGGMGGGMGGMGPGMGGGMKQDDWGAQAGMGGMGACARMCKLVGVGV